MTGGEDPTRRIDPELLAALMAAENDPDVATAEPLLEITSELPVIEIAEEPVEKEGLAVEALEAARAVSALRAARAAERTAITKPEPRKSTIAPPVEDLLAGSAHFRLPREGACIFLLIDLTNFPAEGKIREDITRELTLLNGNADYHLLRSGNWLQIVGSEERAGSDLAITQKSIDTLWSGSKSVMGTGSVQHLETGFKIEGDQEPGDFINYANSESGHYMTPALDTRRQQPDNREFTHCEIETGEPTTEGLTPILDAIPKVTKRLGGPDKYIGNSKARIGLARALKDDKTRLITIKGPRGIGKSRYQDEVLAGLKFKEISCSFDASDRNVAGKGLVTVTNQIAAALEESNRVAEGTTTPIELNLKTKFIDKYPTPAQQVEYAQANAKELAEMCSEALRVISWTIDENVLFRLEDLHHADEFSSKHLEGLITAFLENTKVTAKVMVSLRPEDFERPELHDKLVRKVQGLFDDDAHKQFELGPLNFAEIDKETGNELSYDYVFHSLPESLRSNLLGNWHRDLAEASGGNPFVMSYFINTILADEDNLIIKDGVINVKSEVLDEIKAINPSNPDALNTHFQQRLSRLPETGKKLVQVVALAGGRLTEDQLDKIAFELPSSAATTAELIAKLVKGRYLIGEPEKAPTTWRMENELFVALANSSLKDPTERKTQLEFLDRRFAEDPDLSADAKFNVKQELAMGKVAAGEEEFWGQYGVIAQDALAEARSRNDYRDGFHRARRIIGTRVQKEPDTEVTIVGGVPALNSILDLLATVSADDTAYAKVFEGIPGNAINTAVNAAMSIARNGTYLAQFKEVGIVLDLLSTISQNHPGLVPNSELLKLKYEHAYQSRNGELMAELLEPLKADAEISDITKITAGIKLAYNRNDFAALKGLYEAAKSLLAKIDETHMTAHESMPSPEVAEIERIATLMGPFIKLQWKVKTRKEGFVLDDDIDHLTTALSDDQFTEAQNLLKIAEKMLADAGEYPLLYDDYSRLNILAIRAELQIYLGKDQAAYDQNREAWRVGDLTAVPETAVRAAKNLGDMLVNKGQARDGLQVYNQQGKISMASLEEATLSSFAMRVQRIRAIDVELLKEWKEDLNDVERARLKEQYEADIQEAFAEFLKLSELSDQNADILSDEASYYILGHFGMILQIAKDLKIEVPTKIFHSPIIRESQVAGAKAFAKTRTDYGLKNIETTYGPHTEVQVKKAGFKHLDHLYEVAKAKVARDKAKAAESGTAPA